MKTIIDASQPVKTKMDTIKINWYLAPEGVTHYMPESDEWYSSWFTLNKNCKTMQREFKSGGGATYDAASYDIERLIRDGLIAKPQSDLIFTQEMCDNGELPSVGMDFMTSIGLYKSVYIGEHCGEDMVVGQGGGDICTFEIGQCLPIAPPIKLIAGNAYQFDFKEQKDLVGICHTYIKYGSKHTMFGSPILDTKWNTEYCTNIQLLTVGNK
jgi:hypothetical protein